MRATSITQNAPGEKAHGINFLTKTARSLLLKKISSISNGCVEIVDPVGTWHSNPDLVSELTITVNDMRFYTDILMAGSNGAASAYRDGFWSCSNLTGLFRLLLSNVEEMDGLETGTATVGNLWLQHRHRARSNTRDGSRQNIEAHYDLGNRMFTMFLDPSMTYSSGIFPASDSTLEEASFEKLDRICRKLELAPHHHVIEIGSGWGSFAMHAAKYYGCHVTTTTISKAQYVLARARIEEADLSHLVDIHLSDYRDLDGQYDKLVSIEMIEAVGHEFLPEYFSRCASLLKPDGQLVIQAITMPDQRYEQSLKYSDFIKQFIFPGSCVPSVTAMMNAITTGSDLRINHLEDFGIHYARTIKSWRDNFMNNLDQIKAQGYGNDFINLWEYYFSYCEAGFRERYISVAQIVMNKPGYRAHAES